MMMRCRPSLASRPARRFAPTTLAPSHPTPRAFSLVEVLLAIFILGIGVISVAALFPAGIAQQRLSADDSLGSFVAENAMSIIRSKVRPEDFGTYEEFQIPTGVTPRPTIAGDFNWLRPGFIFTDDSATPNMNERGAINIFSGGSFDASEYASGYGNGATPELYGIPYSIYRYGPNPADAPRILISQGERYYPSTMMTGALDIPKPQYVWDCMFRRFQGKILVAIFVYRVTVVGGGSTVYYVSPNVSTPALPPLPIWLDLAASAAPSTYCADGPWHPGGPDNDVTTYLPGGTPPRENDIVLGTPGGTPHNPDNETLAWQEPRQWLLDQNNNIHRVLGQSRASDSDPVFVQLGRPAPTFVGTIGFNLVPCFYQNITTGETVSDIWYLPQSVTDSAGQSLTLTPVYVTVKEL